MITAYGSAVACYRTICCILSYSYLVVIAQAVRLQSVDVYVVIGRIFPSRGDLHIVPFNDEALYMEQFSKAHFW